jgi:hypothetical protein
MLRRQKKSLPHAQREAKTRTLTAIGVTVYCRESSVVACLGRFYVEKAHNLLSLAADIQLLECSIVGAFN